MSKMHYFSNKIQKSPSLLIFNISDLKFRDLAK